MKVVKLPKQKSDAVALESIYDDFTSTYAGDPPINEITGFVTSGPEFTVRVLLDTFPAPSIAVTVYVKLDGCMVICVPDVIPDLV